MSLKEESYLDVSLRKIAKGAGIVLFGTLIGRAFGYGSRMVIARFLGVNNYGLISLGFAALTIAASISAIGLPEGVTRYVSFYKGKEDNERIKGTILSAIKMNLPISIVFFIFLFFGADWISIHFFHDLKLTPVLRIFSIGIPFLVLARDLLSATVGFQKMEYNVYTDQVTQEVLKLIGIIALVSLGFNVIGAAWGWILGTLSMPFLAFYFLEKKVFPVFKTNIKAISTEKELFMFSWPLIFTSIAGMVMGFMDTLMLGYFCTSYEVGIYNAALPTAILIRLFPGSIVAIYMPVITELYAREKYNDLKDAYSVVIKWVLSLAFPAFVLMVLFSDNILLLLFGTEYMIGAESMIILAFGFLISVVLSCSSGVLTAYGRTKITMGCYLIGSLTNFCLNFYLIPIYGLKGAAVATAISSIFMGILYFISAYYISNIQPFKKVHLKPIFSSIVTALIIYAPIKYLIGDSLIAFIVMFFVFLVVYFFLLLLTKGFDKNDLMVMRAIYQRLGIRLDWLENIIKKFM